MTTGYAEYIVGRYNYTCLLGVGVALELKPVQTEVYCIAIRRACYALNKLDTSSDGIYAIQKPSGHVEPSLRSGHYGGPRVFELRRSLGLGI